MKLPQLSCLGTSWMPLGLLSSLECVLVVVSTEYGTDLDLCSQCKTLKKVQFYTVGFEIRVTEPVPFSPQQIPVFLACSISSLQHLQQQQTVWTMWESTYRALSLWVSFLFATKYGYICLCHVRPISMHKILQLCWVSSFLQVKMRTSVSLKTYVTQVESRLSFIFYWPGLCQAVSLVVVESVSELFKLQC